jgi:hypothetical protein
MYFGGSTWGGNSLGVAGSSKSPPSPTSPNFPVYNPNDGSYWQANYPQSGSAARGFISAIDLTTYELEYSSIITRSHSSNGEFTAIYDISFNGDDGMYCGKGGAAGARLGFFEPTTKMFASTLNQTHSNWTGKAYFSDIVSTPNGVVFFGMDENGSDPLLSSPTGSYFSSTVGKGYLVMLDRTSIYWDSYLGDNNHMDFYWGGGNYPRSKPVIFGKGRLAYNAAASTFLAASTSGYSPVQTQPHPGYFYEAINSTIPTAPTQIYGDLHLNAFLSANSNIIAEHTWGTMFGGHSPNSQLPPHFPFYDTEYLSSVETYSLNNKSYVVIASTSYSLYGSITSDVDKFPVADLAATNFSWFKQNSAQATSPPVAFTATCDISLTRFEITDISQGNISITENEVASKHTTVYPNPSIDLINVHLDLGDIERLEVFDITGKPIFDFTSNKRLIPFRLI